MKTSDSIEQQDERKQARNDGISVTHNTDPVTDRRRRSLANLKPWPPGKSANPGGRPKVDLAAEIARAVFENNAPALYAAYTKALKKGNAYAFKELSDRAYGKMTERIEHIAEFRGTSEADLLKRQQELEDQLRQMDEPRLLPPGAKTPPN